MVRWLRSITSCIGHGLSTEEGGRCGGIVKIFAACFRILIDSLALLKSQPKPKAISFGDNCSAASSTQFIPNYEQATNSSRFTTRVHQNFENTIVRLLYGSVDAGLLRVGSVEPTTSIAKDLHKRRSNRVGDCPAAPPMPYRSGCCVLRYSFLRSSFPVHPFLSPPLFLYTFELTSR